MLRSQKQGTCMNLRPAWAICIVSFSVPPSLMTCYTDLLVYLSPHSYDFSSLSLSLFLATTSRLQPSGILWLDSFLQKTVNLFFRRSKYFFMFLFRKSLRAGDMNSKHNLLGCFCCFGLLVLWSGRGVLERIDWFKVRGVLFFSLRVSGERVWVWRGAAECYHGMSRAS